MQEQGGLFRDGAEGRVSGGPPRRPGDCRLVPSAIAAGSDVCSAASDCVILVRGLQVGSEGQHIRGSSRAKATAMTQPDDLYYDPYDYGIDADPHPVWK